MRAKMLLALLVLLDTSAHAETSYSQPSEIVSMTVGETIARVRLAQMSPAGSCSTQNWYALDLTNGAGKEMYAALLSSKSMNKKIYLQLINCYANYPKITHVYLCEISSCQS